MNPDQNDLKTCLPPSDFSIQHSAFSLSEFLARHAKPYDPATDDYERPPFAADIKEGKNDPIYNAHSYHTKVPPRAIIPYILHYTQPGDLVLDLFCGSGMTGVAAQMCAQPPADILESFPELKDRVGPRACILNDLSPAACHIAYNYNTPVDVEALKREFERIKAAVKDEFDWLYGTEHYEPAVGLYDPANYEVQRRLKNKSEERPPSPRPSPPGEGETSAASGRDGHAQLSHALSAKTEKGGDGKTGVGVSNERAQLHPLPGGEGRGEGERASEFFGDTLLGGEERTWELLTKAEVEARLGYPVTELPRDEKWGDLDVAKVKQWVCIPATIQYTVWSDVYRCEGFVTIEEPTGKLSTRGKNAGKAMVEKKRVARGCGCDIVMWHAAVDAHGEVREVFGCPVCSAQWKKMQLRRQGSVPVVANVTAVGLKHTKKGYEATRLRYDRKVTAREFKALSELAAKQIPYWVPDTPMDTRGPQYRRNALQVRKIEKVTDFWSNRNLWAYASLWERAGQATDKRVGEVLRFGLTGITAYITKKQSWGSFIFRHSRLRKT